MPVPATWWTRNRIFGTIGVTLGLLLVLAEVFGEGGGKGAALVFGLGFIAAGGYRIYTG